MEIGHISAWGVHLRVIQLAVSLLAFVPLSLYLEGSQWRENGAKWREWGELVAGGESNKGDAFRVPGQIKAPFSLFDKAKGREMESECDRGKEMTGGERETRVQRSERGRFMKLNISSCVQKDLSSHHLYITENKKSYHPNLSGSTSESEPECIFSLFLCLWFLFSFLFFLTPPHMLILSVWWFIPSSPECHWREPFGSPD